LLQICQVGLHKVFHLLEALTDQVHLRVFLVEWRAEILLFAQTVQHFVLVVGQVVKKRDLVFDNDGLV